MTPAAVIAGNQHHRQQRTRIIAMSLSHHHNAPAGATSLWARTIFKLASIYDWGYKIKWQKDEKQDNIIETE
jgi:hypothetical protein